ncbi:MAG: glycosyltransferase [Solirubrobacterales bacterium]|nr:glycosyltransferase [Solirubrobacterales bacterium]
MNARRALIIASRLPEFDRESGLLRVSDLIDMLLRRGWEVTFGCMYEPTDGERYARELQQRGVETHAPLESLDSIRNPGRFDLAIIAYWYVAERFLPELRQASPSTRVIVDSVDLHFLRNMRDNLRPDGGAPGQLETSQARKMIREINAYAAADAVLTVSEKEAAMINDVAGRPDLALALPDAEELPRSRVPLRKRGGILFLGNFLHPPNIDAATFLCEEIVPRLDPSLLAEHEISIVGTAAEEHVGELADGLPHVKTVGWVPSVVPYLNAARASVVPLRYGAGTKRKVIQALMAGTPTVTTTVGAEGLGVRDRRHVMLADDPGSFAARIEHLLRRPLAWRSLARRGRTHVLRLHGRATVAERFDRVLETVLARAAQPAAVQPAGADGVLRTPEYARLVARVREVVESNTPAKAQVLVATKGDAGLLAFSGRRGWHFPRDKDAGYAGYHPADSEAAIAHLEELRAQGATHLVLPRTAFWWLDHYRGLREHLDSAYRSARRDEDAIVYDLAGEERGPAPSPQPPVQARERADGHRDPDAAGPGRDPEPAATSSAVTAELIRGLRPSALAAASSYRNGGAARRALVLGVYLAGKPNTAEHIAATLARSVDLEVRQRWVALGGEPADGELGAVTALTVAEPTPKYALLNRLLADEDLASYDFVVTTDDDIVVPEGFLDLLLGIQAGVGFALAQPARTQNSHVDHPIVLQQHGVVARRTLYVEIGPVASFGREIHELVFPFDETNAMGWGFENVWAHLLRERGISQGIVDAVPVDHSMRSPVAHYKWADANADRDRYFANHPHLPYEECFRVLDVVGVER